MAMINGTSGSDKLIGTNVDDTLYGGRDKDLIDGRDGIDRAIFTGRYEDSIILKSDPSNLKTEIQGPDGNDKLANVELLVFDNGVYDVRTGTFAANPNIVRDDGKTENFWVEADHLYGTADEVDYFVFDMATNSQYNLAWVEGFESGLDKVVFVNAGNAIQNTTNGIFYDGTHSYHNGFAFGEDPDGIANDGAVFRLEDDGSNTHVLIHDTFINQDGSDVLVFQNNPWDLAV